MKRVVSYRQKIIELARIYKINRVLDTNLKLTTYEIELELLKNKVPIPSRRGYFSHKIINEICQPIYSILQKNFGKSRDFLKEKLSINFNLKKVFTPVKNNFNSFIFNINNFFIVLNKTLIDSLNDIYNSKFEDKLIKKFIWGAVYSSLVIMLVASGFYIKTIITDVDGLKILVEIKSDKKKIAETPEASKENQSKKSVKKPEASKENQSKKSVKKPEASEEPYDPETDYSLNTQTVLNLFEDLDYDLSEVRSRKLVKPIYFTRLPKDLDEMRSTSRKKETFLQILLPLVVAENERIQKDRTYLLKILKKNQSEKNVNWINKKYKEYKVSKKNIDELIRKIDIIPTSIALAQAAKESGWGTSRFALEGNAIFGQWTWNGVGMAPLDKDEDQKHKILKFPLLRASVKAYITNLNTHSGYKSFRKKRSELRAANKDLSGLDLIHELDNYAQTGKEYTKVLEKIIKQNDLDEFETVEIEDFKGNKQLKL